MALRALILDDAREDVELLLYELKSKGFAINATVTHNQDEFLTALQEGSFDVVLSDYRLPEWTGLDAFAALKAIKADRRTCCIPVIVMTSSNHEDDLLECYRGGANSYITKPVNLSLFEETVKQIGKYWLGFNLPPPEAAFEKR